MRVELSRFIEGDLEDIGDWIAQDNPRHAVLFLQQFREAFRTIAQNPFHYQLRPDIGEDARLAVVGRYVVLFRIKDETVRIERVLFADLPTLFTNEEADQ